jgi:hypothetical protein
MSENVIHLGTRKTLAENHAELKRAEAVHEKALNENAKNHLANLTETLTNVQARVDAGELDGLVVLGRNPNNGAFMSVAVLDGLATRVDTYLAYAGILGAMQLDLTDMANAGPHMNTDGTFFAVENVLTIPAEEDDV